MTASSVLTRTTAALAVAQVLLEQDPLEQALAGQRGYADLEGRDRAFSRAIVATTFRRLGQVDAVLKPFLRKTPPPDVHAALRTATAQMVFMDVAPHAVVGDTVNVMRALGRDGFANMTNAVLRKVATDGKRLAANVAPKQNLPGWIRGAWERAYGQPAMRRTAAQFLKPPPLDLSVKSDPQGWAERLGGQVLPTGTVRLPTIGDITALDGFESGEWWAQDIAASLPVKMMDIGPGMRVLDMCAAPGGKTLQLAALGAEVTAVDVSGARLERLRENLARTKLDATVVEADALQWEPDAPFDAVLLDAPCSATGTMRRHPDVLHNKTPKTVSVLSRLQRKLAARAAGWVRPGGQLLYAVCSLQPEEGERQLPQLLEDLPAFRLNPNLTAMMSSLPEDILSGGVLRSMPHHLGPLGGMDGFYAARLERVGD